jgi:hypothetical protein
VMGMFGIIVMVIENELSSAGVYGKVSWYKHERKGKIPTETMIAQFIGK